MYRAKVILPKRIIFDARKLERVIENTLDGVAESGRVDFEVTTQTWNNKPAFNIEKERGKRTVYTDSAQYAYVNYGTRAHTIRPRSASQLAFPANYRAKTTPRVIASRSGGASGPTVYTREVHHPGTQAREFDKEIKKKWDKEFPQTIASLPPSSSPVLKRA